MALRNIVTDGDEILRKKSKEVTLFNERLHELLDDMWETMAAADGVGLAAPQVGVLKRAVIIDVTPHDTDGDEESPEPVQTRFELINPVLLSKEGEAAAKEGCLSVPGLVGMVRRPKTVSVRAQDRAGNSFELTGEGLLAKAICHEIDHLEGVLFTDIAEFVEEPE